jgi:hypothetical protein
MVEEIVVQTFECLRRLKRKGKERNRKGCNCVCFVNRIPI